MKYKLIKTYPGSRKLGYILSALNDGKNSNYYIDSSWIKPQDFPEFWEQIVDKDYEILSFISGGRILKCQYESEYKFFHYIDDKDFNVKPFIGRTVEELSKSSLYSIHSIKCLSDGEIFTVGDKVVHINNVSNPIGIIESFHLMSNGIWFKTNNYDVPMSYIAAKTKQPLFITEDGVDIYEGDNFYTIDSNFKIQTTFGGEDEISNAWFSKEVAEEYLLLNKPCLSIRDIFKGKTSFSTPFMEDLKKIVKSKL